MAKTVAAELRPTPIDKAVGDWNKRQTWNDWGAMFLICSLCRGGYAVCRFDKDRPGQALVAANPVATVAEAVAQAERLTRSAMQ